MINGNRLQNQLYRLGLLLKIYHFVCFIRFCFKNFDKSSCFDNLLRLSIQERVSGYDKLFLD